MSDIVRISYRAHGQHGANGFHQAGRFSGYLPFAEPVALEALVWHDGLSLPHIPAVSHALSLAHFPALKPPSMMNSVPVTKPASSLAR